MRIALFFLVVSLTGCDLDNMKKCEWTLEPEADNISKLSESDRQDGFIPVCARNRVTNKQNCNLKAKLDFAKKVFQRKFKYTDLKIDKESKYPKTVQDIKSFCK